MNDPLTHKLREDFSINSKEEEPELVISVYEAARHRAADEIERFREREARLLAVLRGLVECCEYTRDSAFYDKSKYVNSVSKSAWSSFCLQVRAARAALAEQDAPA